MEHFNVIGPQVRRLRFQRGWSQNDLAIKLQLLGMDYATRGKVSKIEARRVFVCDDDLIFISRALGVSTEELYPDFVRFAKQLYEAVCISKASQFGLFFFVLLSCSKLGAGVLEIAATIASV